MAWLCENKPIVNTATLLPRQKSSSPASSCSSRGLEVDRYGRGIELSVLPAWVKFLVMHLVCSRGAPQVSRQREERDLDGHGDRPLLLPPTAGDEECERHHDRPPRHRDQREVSVRPTEGLDERHQRRETQPVRLRGMRGTKGQVL